MLKRFLLILTLILTFTTTATKSFATDNFLNAVLLEGTDFGYNILLRSDGLAKVKKEIQSEDKIVLTLKGITPSANLTTLYKDTADVNNIIVENNGNNEVKIYIQAQDIAKANVIFDTPNSAPIPVADTFAKEKIVWSLISVGILLLAMKSTKSLQVAKIELDVNNDNREREMEMYKNFKRELASKPSMNYEINKQFSTSYATNSIERRRENKRETLRNLEHLTRV